MIKMILVMLCVGLAATDSALALPKLDVVESASIGYPVLYFPMVPNSTRSNFDTKDPLVDERADQKSSLFAGSSSTVGSEAKKAHTLAEIPPGLRIEVLSFLDPNSLDSFGRASKPSKFDEKRTWAFLSFVEIPKGIRSVNSRDQIIIFLQKCFGDKGVLGTATNNRVRRLNLSSCEAVDDALLRSACTSFPNLTSVNVDNCLLLTHESFEKIPTSLVELRLGRDRGNREESFDHDGLKGLLKKLPGLQILDLSGNWNVKKETLEIIPHSVHTLILQDIAVWPADFKVLNRSSNELRKLDISDQAVYRDNEDLDIGEIIATLPESIVELSARRLALDDKAFLHITTILTKLKTLDLRNTDITNVGLFYLPRRLLRLNLSETRITPDGLKNFNDKFPFLEALTLSHDEFVLTRILLSQFPSSLLELKLEVIVEPGAFLGSDKGLPKLKELGMPSGSNLVYKAMNTTDESLTELPTSLVTMDLESSGVTSAGLKGFGERFPKLKTLILTECEGITDDVFQELPKGLTFLSVKGTRVTSDGVAEFRKNNPGVSVQY